MKEVDSQFQLIATALKSLHYKLTCFNLEAASHTLLYGAELGAFSILIWDLHRTNFQKHQECDGVSAHRIL